VHRAGLVDEAGVVRPVLSKHRDPALTAALTAFATAQAHELDAATPTRVTVRTGEAEVLDASSTVRLLGPDADPELLAPLAPCSVLVVPPAAGRSAT